jgi:hypothetical protein
MYVSLRLKKSIWIREQGELIMYLRTNMLSRHPTRLYVDLRNLVGQRTVTYGSDLLLVRHPKSSSSPANVKHYGRFR